jgi:hypothetical protein
LLLYAIATNTQGNTVHLVHAACLVCPRGKYSTTAGSTTCKECPKGKYEEGFGSIDCKTCDPGMVSEAGGASCAIICKPGKYNTKIDIEGDPGCQNCAPGQFTNKVRAIV